MHEQTRLRTVAVFLLLGTGLMVLGRALGGRPIHNPRAFLAGLATGVVAGLFVLLLARRLGRNRGA